ncbi:MAG: amidohydrolase [Caulobacterales bacterium]|nr:amidohydrolase [Caulobacterales bacterium]
MIIDTQSHYIPRTALRFLEDARWGGVRPSGLPAALNTDHLLLDLETRLREMDRLGVDVAVLSFAPVGPAPDTALDLELARRANDGLIAACAVHPSRFVALARLPLDQPDAAIAEARRVADAPEMRGVALLAEATRYKPDALDLEDLWRLAAEKGWPLMLHPSAGVADLSPAFADFGLDSALHTMVTSTIVLARLIFSGVLDRHPRLDIIATHLGGVAPFLAERFDSRGRGAREKFSHYLKQRIFMDNCGFTAGPALRCALDVVGPARIVLGSDWPSRPIEDCLAPLAALSDADRRAIAGETASRWFDPAQAARP